MRCVEDRRLSGRCTSSVQGSSWADRLELVGDDDRLVGFVGALPVRLLIDVAIAQLLGGEAISGLQGLRHLAPVTGPVPSAATVWRAPAEDCGRRDPPDSLPASTMVVQRGSDHRRSEAATLAACAALYLWPTTCIPAASVGPSAKDRA
jgi:hypothetical protein